MDTGYRFAFPACSASVKTATHRLRCLIHCCGGPHSIASDERTHCTRSVAVSKHSWNSLLFPSETADPINRRGIGKLGSGGGTRLQGWGNVLQEAVYALKTVSFKWH